MLVAMREACRWSKPPPGSWRVRMSVTQRTTTDQQAPEPLRAAYDAAVAAWPRIALSFEQFCSAVSKLGGVGTPAYPADVYLCIACASGSSAAYQALEAAYF